MPRYFSTEAISARFKFIPRLYSYKTKTLELLGLLLLITNNAAQSQTIPTARLSDWKNAGTDYSFREFNQTYNFLSEGGVNDGISSNDDAMQSLLDKANGKKTLIFFPAGVYYFREAIELPSHITLTSNPGDSSTLLFRLSETKHLISVRGEGVKFSVALTQNAFRGQKRIEIADGSVFRKGDYIRINDKDSTLITSDWAKGSTGQINQIDSISGNTLFLRSSLRRSFLSSLDGTVSRLEMKEGISIENLRIVRLDTTVGQSSNIYFEYTANSLIRCVESRNCNYAHIELRNSSNVEISGNFLQKAFSYGDGGKGYGVLLHFASGECLIKDNTYSTLRHAMVMQAGSNGNIFAYNYSVKPYWTGVFAPSDAAGDLVLHGNYPYANLFEGNVVENIVVDESHGINGHHNVFFRNRADNYGIVMSTNIPTDSQIFVGNEITANTLFTGKFVIKGSGHFLHGNNVKGVLTPANSTVVIPETSLFMDSAASPYYVLKSAWPPIGYPNLLNSRKTEVQSYFLNGQPVMCVPPPAPVEVDELAVTDKVLIYPNPSSQGFNIRIPEHDELIRVTMYTTDGKMVWRAKGNYIPGGFSNGMYFVRVEIKGKSPYAEKVIISNF